MLTFHQILLSYTSGGRRRESAGSDRHTKAIGSRSLWRSTATAPVDLPFAELGSSPSVITSAPVSPLMSWPRLGRGVRRERGGPPGHVPSPVGGRDDQRECLADHLVRAVSQQDLGCVVP